MRNRPANDPEVFSFHVVDDVIRAIVQAAQLQGAIPLASKERVVHLLILADDVGFRPIKTNIVERTQILPTGKTLLLIKLQPLLEALRMFGRKIETAMFIDQRRQHKLRTHHSSNTKSRREIIVIVA